MADDRVKASRSADSAKVRTTGDAQRPPQPQEHPSLDESARDAARLLALSGPPGVGATPPIDSVLRLQRAIGNRATTVLLRGSAAPNSAGIAVQRDAKMDGPGSPLPSSLREEMEVAFATDLSGVRVFEGHQAPLLGGVAYAQGQDIHVASGRFDPTSHAGRALIGHELAHVLQHQEGRMAASGGSGGIPQENSALEQEADAQGDRAARGERAREAGGDRTDAPREAGDAPIHLLKFKNVQEAEAWLKPRLTDAFSEDDAWESFQTMVADTEYAKEEDFPANYDMLLNAYKNIAASKKSQGADETRNQKKRQELTPDIWIHISSGEVNAKDKIVKGYHWKGLGAKSAATTTGAKKNQQPNGTYRQSVVDRATTKIKKSTDSSFFPDDWSEADVRMAIEYATRDIPSKPLFTVTIPNKGKGMILFFNGDSYFPNIQ